MAITLSLDGYCEATDVAAELQQLTISTTSEPTTAQVEAFITEEFALIGGMLIGSNYTHPGGSLAVSAGTIIVVESAYMGGTSVRLQGSGGTLSGSVQKGDFVTFAGDAQPYFITKYAEVDDDGDIGLTFSPQLERDSPAATVATYTAGAGAGRILKRLNVLCAAIRTMRAAYGPEVDVEDLITSRDRIWDGVANGGVVLIGAHRVSQTDGMHSARALRA